MEGSSRVQSAHIVHTYVKFYIMSRCNFMEDSITNEMSKLILLYVTVYLYTIISPRDSRNDPAASDHASLIPVFFFTYCPSHKDISFSNSSS